MRNPAEGSAAEGIRDKPERNVSWIATLGVSTIVALFYAARCNVAAAVTMGFTLPQCCPPLPVNAFSLVGMATLNDTVSCSQETRNSR